MNQTTQDKSRLVFPWAGAIYEPLKPYAYPLIRIWMGANLVPHGFDKLFQGGALKTANNPVMKVFFDPVIAAYFVGGIEFFGGLLLVLGLLTRFAAGAIAIQMFVISFFVLWPTWAWTSRGMEFAFFMMIVCIAIFIRGGGKLSLDSKLPREL